MKQNVLQFIKHILCLASRETIVKKMEIVSALLELIV